MRNRAIAIVMMFFLATASVRARQAGTSAAQDNSDNSRQNRQHTATAQDQSNDRADRVTAARVRRAIVKDDSLSVYGHNVKIIVEGGHVTLEGPVHSQSEREEIASDAATVVASSSIVDKLTVA